MRVLSNWGTATKAAVAWLLPGVLLGAYLIWTDRGVVPMDPPQNGASVMEQSRKAPAKKKPTAGAARLPVKPPQRPLEQQLVELVTPRPGQMVRTSEQKLWQALAQAPDNGELYLHLAQLCSLRREPAEAVRMLRLAARDRVLSSTHLNQRALFQDAAFEPIKYTPEFLTYVRSLPEAKE